MQAFEYANPMTEEQAVELLADRAKKAVPLAGGTDLLSLMKDGIERPERLVNLKSIDSMRGIRASAQDGLRIGALVTLDELLASEQVAAAYPSLVQAASGVRSPQLRWMGTLGGELLQRPRCWYYRSGFGLLAQRQGRSMVLEGDNRYHAILGTVGPAWFVHPSSLAPALVALGARAHVFGRGGEREEPLLDLYQVPTREGETETTLEAGEILTAISVPPASRTSATYEVRQKEGLDWPLAAAAAALEMDGDSVASARVVLGHVAPNPYSASAANRVLEGEKLTAALAERAGAAAVKAARALSQNGYKIQLAKVAAKRAILRAAGREV